MKKLAVLALLLTACADHHARQVITAYQSALQKGDEAAYARLASPAMRRSVSQGDCKRDDTFFLIDIIMKQTVRRITMQDAIVYLGWEKDRGGRNVLWPLLVGKGTALAHFGPTSNEPVASNDWQVSMICGREWALLDVRDAAEQQRVEDALPNVDATLFTQWLQEGNDDARKAILAALQRH